MPALVYAECAPGDAARMGALMALGYRDEDGLVRTVRALRHGPIYRHLPQGCTIVRDYLADENESKYFLERYNAMFGRSRDMAWLKGLKKLPDFARLLMIAPTGLRRDGGLVGFGRGVVRIALTSPAGRERGRHLTD